jgi:hypothetical protein
MIQTYPMKTVLSILTFCLILNTPSPGQKTIPIEISKNGHIMVKASINGVEGNFIFDTGAGLHVISGKFFQKISSQKRDSSYFTGFRHTGERLDGPMYLFEEVSLGSLTQANPWVGVYPGFDAMGFDGLISCKLIEDDIITVDPKGRQIIVESKESIVNRKKKEIPLLIHEDRDRLLDFFINVRINDTFDAIMEFDTGAGYSPLLLHSRYMHYAGLDTTAMEIRSAGTGFGTMEKIYFDKTKKVYIHVPGTDAGGKPNVIFKPSLIYDGLTSYIIFGDSPWTLDLASRRMYIPL